MQRLEIGARAFHKVNAAASSSFQPLFDRAAIIRRVLLDVPSATDTWIFSTTGRELARFRQDSLGNMQMLGGSAASFPKVLDIFWYCKFILGFDLTYPVPQGLTFSVSSVGGATADIVIEYTEHTPDDISMQMPNHPLGNTFFSPLVLAPGAALTQAAGIVEYNMVTQYGAAWLPPFTGQQELPAGFAVDILSVWYEGIGVNTFSGAANHVSASDHIALVRNGYRMFTRDANDGLSNIGPVAAAGSVNSVYGALITPFPAFQLMEEPQWQPLIAPLPLRPGDQYQWLTGISGDSTGGADYSKQYLGLLLKVQLTGLQP